MARNEITIDGLSCTYYTVGSGPAIICLHGWAQSAATWNKLREQLPDYTLYMFDLPGFGTSTTPSTPWNIQDYAHFVRKCAEKLGLTEAPLVGHSFGGRIAAMYAKQYSPPALVIFASGSPHRSLLRTFCKLVIRIFQLRGISNIYLATHASEPDLYKNISCPTLLIYGRWDWITPLRSAKKIADTIPHSELHILSAGHFPHTWRAKESAKIIHAFFEKLQTQ